MRQNPHLYEVHALRWLNRLRNHYGKRLTLASIPDSEWKRLTDLGFELVWLMGVWKRSPKDIAGSPYAIYEYVLDPSLGQKGELKELKKKLNRMGLGLILDFVPNHLAMDHPWTMRYPERFVSGTQEDWKAHPEWFFKTANGRILAHGRDPNFPPWNDTVQVNFFSTEMREALTAELIRVSEVCDGVRCDMAMLALNHVFERVWGDILGKHPRLQEEFWPKVIETVKNKRENFIFIAEAYWGLEWTLQEMGFDYAYDKILYDRMRYETASQIWNHLQAEELYHRRSLRFIENHDEPRAANVFGPERARASAVILSTVPGLRLFYEGQLEGQTTQLPIQLVHEPQKTADGNMVAFYEKLLKATRHDAFHDGEWKLLEFSQAAQHSMSHQHLLAWVWVTAKDFKLVMLNFSRVRSKGRLKIPHSFPAQNGVKFHDEITGKILSFSEEELYNEGMMVELEPWEYRILSRNQ
ncbi:MAG: alpha-amylase [Candidatus Omnitrophica bacterium]|nr:alpha-amylase [Candidatus Omnitrophota bacterium]